MLCGASGKPLPEMCVTRLSACQETDPQRFAKPSTHRPLMNKTPQHLDSHDKRVFTAYRTGTIRDRHKKKVPVIRDLTTLIRYGAR